MGTTLTGTTPQDTYDSLIKVTDNGPLSGTAKYLSDGLGNDSILALSTTALGIGTASPTSLAQLNGTAGTTHFRISEAGATIGFVGGANGIISGATGSLAVRAEAGLILSSAGNSQTMVLTSTGNVGIGATSPDTLLTLGSIARTDSTAGIKIFRGGGTASYATYGFAGNAVINSVGGDLVIQVESSERARFTTAGLCFGGDYLAANALDDYEEGTWTMGVSFGGASVGVTTSANTGTYTKIGRQVTVNGLLTLTSKGSSTGTANVTGLPFTIANAGQNYSSASMRLYEITFANQFQAYGAIGQTVIAIDQITEAGVVTPLTNSDFTNNSIVVVSLTYFV